MRAHELRAGLEFLREIYRLGNFEQFVERVLTGLPGLVPADIVAYCEMNPARKLSRNWTNPPEFSSDKVNRLWQPHMHEHPHLQHIARGGSGRALRVEDMVARPRFRRTGLFNEFYRAIGVEGMLCLAIDVPRPLSVGVALHRDRWSFRENERDLIELLRPHLAQAWRNAKTVSRMQAEMKLLRRTLEQLNRGVIVLDSIGHIRLMTPEAQHLMVERYGRPGDADGRLPEELRRWVRHQLSLVDTVDSLAPRSPLVLEGRRGRLEIRIVRDSRQILLMLDERTDNVSPAVLEPLGLTRREAEVLAWTAQGKTDGETATILNMSPRTVQKHMERVRDKLGVETRTAAARIALETLRTP